MAVKIYASRYVDALAYTCIAIYSYIYLLITLVLTFERGSFNIEICLY
jgi:hypothetical protein